MEFDYSTIEDKFLSLPDEVKFAMTSPQVAENIKEISSKFGLLLDQMDILFDVTSYVMLGLIPQNQFTQTLARELNIGEKQARIITAEISDKVFSSIRESMRSFENHTAPSPKIVNETYKTNSGQFGRIDKEDAEESPHADLESAGDFKIETTVPTELEMMQERREYLAKQRAMEEQKASEVSSIAPKVDVPITKIEEAKIPEQKIKAEEIKPVTEEKQASTENEVTSNFDPHTYYNFSSANEEGGEEQNTETESKSENTDENAKIAEDKSEKKDEETIEVAQEKVEDGEVNSDIEEEEEKEDEKKKSDMKGERENGVDKNESDNKSGEYTDMEDDENAKPSFDLYDAIKEHQAEEETVKNAVEGGTNEVKPQKEEVAIPTNLPTEESVEVVKPDTAEVRHMPEPVQAPVSNPDTIPTPTETPIQTSIPVQTPNPKPIDVELNKLISQIPAEEPKKDANIKVAEETIKAIESNPPAESINLLDKQNIKKTEEPKVEEKKPEPSQEELRNDIRSQIAQNSPAIDISDSNNFKQAEKMLEDKVEEPAKPHFISDKVFADQSKPIPSPISRPSTSNKGDPYREAVE